MNNQILDTEYNGKSETMLTTAAIAFLSETRKWTKFLSILGFVGLGFLVLMGLFMGTVLTKFSNIPGGSPMPAGFFTIIYLIIAALYFFPILYLYRFSNYLGRALSTNSSSDLTEAFSNLKSHYKFIGILAIIFLSFYALVIIGSLMVAAFR